MQHTARAAALMLPVLLLPPVATVCVCRGVLKAVAVSASQPLVSIQHGQGPLWLYTSQAEGELLWLVYAVHLIGADSCSCKCHSPAQQCLTDVPPNLGHIISCMLWNWCTYVAIRQVPLNTHCRCVLHSGCCRWCGVPSAACWLSAQCQSGCQQPTDLSL